MKSVLIHGLLLARRTQIPRLQPASAEMDDVTPENLANLQTAAKHYVSSISADLAKICSELKDGRGSEMPGTGLDHA